MYIADYYYCTVNLQIVGGKNNNNNNKIHFGAIHILVSSSNQTSITSIIQSRSSFGDPQRSFCFDLLPVSSRRSAS